MADLISRGGDGVGKLIDADVFDSILQDAQAECKKNGGNFRFGVLNSVRANLANQPAVNVAPVVHGRWIQADLDEDYVTCSCCKANGSKDRMAWTPEFAKILKYCPNCGAKMDGGEINVEQ